MDFDFATEQTLLREQVRQLLKEQCPIAEARRLLNSGEEFPTDTWRTLGTLGYLGAVIPERYGGAGMGYPELCIIAEEIGRVLAPLPFLSSVYLASELLMLAGNERQKGVYLPKLASAGGVICVGPLKGDAEPSVDAMVRYDGHRVSGRIVLMLDGDIADQAIVVADQTADGSSLGTSLVLVDLNNPGVSRRAVTTLDPSRRHAEVVIENVPGEILGDPGSGAHLLKLAKTRAAILLSFEQLGGAERCLEMARDYALQRHAFGRPIGSFQAIKHKLVDIYARNVIARAHAYFGAWALSVWADDLGRAAACAHIAATAAFSFAAQEAIQVHGGIGFTYEHDCHLYYRRARLLGSVLGNVLEWKEELAVILDSSHAVDPSRA